MAGYSLNVVSSVSLPTMSNKGCMWTYCIMPFCDSPKLFTVHHISNTFKAVWYLHITYLFNIIFYWCFYAVFLILDIFLLYFKHIVPCCPFINYICRLEDIQVQIHVRLIPAVHSFTAFSHIIVSILLLLLYHYNYYYFYDIHFIYLPCTISVVVSQSKRLSHAWTSTTWATVKHSESRVLHSEQFLICPLGVSTVKVFGERVCRCRTPGLQGSQFKADVPKINNKWKTANYRPNNGLCSGIKVAASTLTHRWHFVRGWRLLYFFFLSSSPGTSSEWWVCAMCIFELHGQFLMRGTSWRTADRSWLIK